MREREKESERERERNKVIERIRTKRETVNHMSIEKFLCFIIKDH